VLFLLFPLAAHAATIEVEGIALGASKADVMKHPGAEVKNGGVAFETEKASVEVAFDAKGRAKRVYASYAKGLLPLKDFTNLYGEPVKQNAGNSTKYVFKVEREGTVVLEKVRGYPGFYVEALK
jgi:hypothetical protein